MKTASQQRTNYLTFDLRFVQISENWIVLNEEFKYLVLKKKVVIKRLLIEQMQQILNIWPRKKPKDTMKIF